jgi:hypothetical protein
MASIRAGGTELGEGFAIVAVFCTLVEFLESCERGHNFQIHWENSRAYAAE